MSPEPDFTSSNATGAHARKERMLSFRSNDDAAWRLQCSPWLATVEQRFEDIKYAGQVSGNFLVLLAVLQAYACCWAIVRLRNLSRVGFVRAQLTTSLQTRLLVWQGLRVIKWELRNFGNSHSARTGSLSTSKPYTRMASNCFSPSASSRENSERITDPDQEDSMFPLGC